MRYRHFHMTADTVGDGSGTVDFIGDYSSTSVKALITPATGQVLELHRMIVHVEDGAGMRAERYGALTELTNGVHIHVMSHGAEFSDLTPHSIKNNAQWGAMCYDVDVKTWGAGNEVLVARYTFDRLGAPIILTDTDNMEVVLSDNFTGLIHNMFHFQGVYITL